MGLLESIGIFVFGGFFGFALGRFGDKIGGHWEGPHHWVYGLVVVFTGLYTGDFWWKLLLIPGGIGCFISDLNDFLHFRFWGTDIPHKWRFWSVL